MKKVLIIGGGLAGLSAGVALAEAGYKVHLLERRAFLGGRAYSFIDQTSGEVIDNGQHLMMGCYQETFKFFAKLKTLDRLQFQKQSRVDFLDEQNGQTTLLCPSWPAPLHLLAGLFRLKGISFADKIRALLIGSALQTKNGKLESKFGNLTVDQWLDSCNQSSLMKERFWYPFAIATLNEDPKVAPATLLIKVLQQAFAGTKEDSTMVTAKVGLSELYTEQAKNFIESHSGQVTLRANVTSLDITGDKCQGIVLKDNTILNADVYISAVPYFALQEFLPTNLLKENSYFKKMQSLTSAPIVSVYLWFDKSITDLGFAGMLGTHLQWMFNKDILFSRSKTEEQLLTFVISAAHKYAKLTKEKLVEIAIADVRRLLPKASNAKVVRSLVVKEHHATFSASVLTEANRPNAVTPINNLFLAGDWTNTGLPATIEGAVLSGHRCAEHIIGSSNN